MGSEKMVSDTSNEFMYQVSHDIPYLTGNMVSRIQLIQSERPGIAQFLRGLVFGREAPGFFPELVAYVMCV